MVQAVVSQLFYFDHIYTFSTQSFKAPTTVPYDYTYTDNTVCCSGYGGPSCEGLKE